MEDPDPVSPKEEIFKRSAAGGRGADVCISVKCGTGTAAFEVNSPLGVAGCARIGFHVGVLAAKLEGVFAFQIGDVVEKL